jgi:hypothetical protein
MRRAWTATRPSASPVTHLVEEAPCGLRWPAAGETFATSSLSGGDAYVCDGVGKP